MKNQKLGLYQTFKWHRRMWRWVSKDACRSKADWPGWIKRLPGLACPGYIVIGNLKKTIQYGCFFCQYDFENTEYDCAECPVDWKTTSATKKSFSCEGPGSFYTIWKDFFSPSSIVSYKHILEEKAMKIACMAPKKWNYGKYSW